MCIMPCWVEDSALEVRVLAVSFGSGFGISQHCESICSSLLDLKIGCLQCDWHKLYIACSVSL